MATAKDIMHPGAQWVSREDTLVHAARLMGEHDIGALPVGDENDRLCGIVTDRDIVVKAIATGQDPANMTCGDLCEGTQRWVDADTEVGDVLRELETHQIKRLPVIENKRLVGMISEADIGRHLGEHEVAEFVENVYAGQ